MIETTQLFSLLFSPLCTQYVLEESGSSLFSLFSDWLPYKTVKKYKIVKTAVSVMNAVLSTTLHIYSSLVSICDYFRGCLLWYKGTSTLPKRHPRK